MDEATEKTCTGCDRVLPLGAYSRSKRGKYGRSARCKTCVAGQAAVYYAANREKIAARHKANPATPEQRSEQNARYQAAHGAERYAANRDELLKRSKLWNKANPEYGAAWRKANPEYGAAWREANREKRAKDKADWRRANPDKVANHQSKYFSQRRGSAHVDDVDILAVYERDGWQCGLCGKAVKRSLKWPDPMSASLDHIVPLSKGGEHSPANCGLAHLRCNMAKGNRGGGEQLALIG